MSTPYFCFDFNDRFNFQYFYICTFFLFAFIMQDMNFIFYSLFAKRYPAYVTRFLFSHYILYTRYSILISSTYSVYLFFIFLMYLKSFHLQGLSHFPGLYGKLMRQQSYPHYGFIRHKSVFLRD
jgi:hypothetical protein